MMLNKTDFPFKKIPQSWVSDGECENRNGALSVYNIS